MFVFIILWVKAEPSWMSFSLPFSSKKQFNEPLNCRMTLSEEHLELEQITTHGVKIERKKSAPIPSRLK